MKKIILAMVAVLIYSTAFAKIVDIPDKFRGTNTICSQAIGFGTDTDVPLFGDLGGVLLIKLCYMMKSGIPVGDTYGLVLYRDEKEIRLSTSAEFKIDNNDVSYMEMIKASTHDGLFMLPMILVRQIREAKTLAIRVLLL